MKMRQMRMILGLCLVAAVLLATTACGPTTQVDQEPAAPDWDITLTWPGGEMTLALVDLVAMPTTDVTIERKDSTNVYTGVTLDHVFTHLSIDDIGEVHLEADDGFSATITADEALSAETLLAFKIDGEMLDDEKNAPLRLVSTVASSRAWVGQLRIIRVEAPPPPSAWEITLAWNGEEMILPIEDLMEMESVEIEVVRGDSVTVYTGVVLSHVLGLASIDEVGELYAEADDGYSATIDGEAALANTTILAYMIDGELIDDEKNAPVRLVSPDLSGRSWVGQLRLLKVE